LIFSELAIAANQIANNMMRFGTAIAGEAKAAAKRRAAFPGISQERA
jgi:hypothetical protein